MKKCRNKQIHTFLGKNMKQKNNLTNILFCIYCLVLIWVVLFKASFSWEAIRLLVREREINLIPFYGLGKWVFLNREMLLNIIIFVPMGTYLCMLGASAKTAVPYGFLASLGLELIELVTRLGTFDVTDLITNTLGTAIGMCAYLLLRLLVKEKKTADRAVNIVAVTVVAGIVILSVLLLIANHE